jgi:hypothetical protein
LGKKACIKAGSTFFTTNFSSVLILKKEVQPDVVIQIGDAYLTTFELQLPRIYENDSIPSFKKYMDEWVIVIKCYKKCASGIYLRKSNLDLLIERYKTELYSQVYLQQLIQQNDTIISKEVDKELFISAAYERVRS